MAFRESDWFVLPRFAYCVITLFLKYGNFAIKVYCCLVIGIMFVLTNFTEDQLLQDLGHSFHRPHSRTSARNLGGCCWRRLGCLAGRSLDWNMVSVRAQGRGNGELRGRKKFSTKKSAKEFKLERIPSSTASSSKSIESSTIKFTDPKNACKKLHRESSERAYSYVRRISLARLYGFSTADEPSKRLIMPVKTRLALSRWQGLNGCPLPVERSMTPSSEDWWRWWGAGDPIIDNLVLSAKVRKGKEVQRRRTTLDKPMYRRLSHRMKFGMVTWFACGGTASVYHLRHQQLMTVLEIFITVTRIIVIFTPSIYPMT